ncbi:SpoIIE family protein phosphatase [Streptomyces actuosus]|uniref:SpoIIE family protein phosphatase n=1 Tax=Streptomyces actuosus TaxID=1885 RepID=A0ABS2VYS0_STRAS|nr:ATP-binding SpoIIE family protein phosphatase [Streptomyces actuosus]MBN0048298.1 SpoIIE family protein phosphatase [Streptomyces actuosus]
MGAVPTQRETDARSGGAPAGGPAEGARRHATLPGSSLAPGAARDLVRAALHEWAELGPPGARHLSDRLVEDAILVVSELVTNAVVHAGTDVRLLCRLEPSGHVVVEVSDQHPSRAPRDGEAVRATPEPPEHGRGLRLVSALADSWGITYCRDAKTVWARLTAEALVRRDDTPHPVAVGPAVDTALHVAGVLAPEPGSGERDREWLGRGALSFLAEASDLLAGQLDEDLVAALTGQLVVPRLADWCAVWLEDEVTGRGRWGDGSVGVVPRLARVWHTDENLVEDLRRVLAADPPCPPDVLRCGPVPYPWPAAVLVPRGNGTRLLPGRAGHPEAVNGAARPTRAAVPAPADDHGARPAGRDDRCPESADRDGRVGGAAGPDGGGAARAGRNGHAAGAAGLGGAPAVPGWPDGQGPAAADGPGPGTVPAVAASHGPAFRDGRGAARAVPDGRAAAPRDRQGPGVALAYRLVAGGRPLGTLVIGRTDALHFPDEITGLVEDLSRRVALAIGAARQYARQATISAVLQRGLLPGAVAEIPGLRSALVHEPCDVGGPSGDFYDLFPAGDGRWCFAVGDVQGKGPEAAVVIGLARPWLRLLAREGYGVADVLDRLNQLLLDDATEAADAAARAFTGPVDPGDGPQNRFLSLLYGELAPFDGGVRCTLASAGHPLPLILGPDGGVRTAARPQTLLGVVEDETYRSETVELRPGDTLLCVTDGVTERRSGSRQFDDGDGLAGALAGCAGLSAELIAERIRRLVHEFGGQPPGDDLALLVLQAE